MAALGMGSTTRWPFAVALVGLAALTAFIRREREDQTGLTRRVAVIVEPRRDATPMKAIAEHAPLEVAAPLAPPVAPAPAEPVVEFAVEPARAEPLALVEVSWSGALRSSSGALFGGVERLRVEALDGSRTHTVPCDAFGRFATVLAPGAWRVSIPTALGALSLAHVDLASVAWKQDIVVPGVCLTGSVRCAEAQRGDDTVLTVDVRLRRADESETRGADLRAGSRYTFLALEPGTYFVTTTQRVLIGAPKAGLTVRVDGTRERMTLDLLVGER
jgi:hypothetical protein